MSRDVASQQSRPHVFGAGTGPTASAPASSVVAREPSTSPGSGTPDQPHDEPLALGIRAPRLVRTAALDRPAGELRFMRDERAGLFARMGVRTVRDELYATPHRYLDFTQVSTVADARIGDEVTVVIAVDEIKVKQPRPHMSLVEVNGYDDTAPISITYFGQPWMAQRFRRGQIVAFSGKVSYSYGIKKMNSAFHDLVADVAGDAAGASGADTVGSLVTPVAPARGVPQARMLPVHHVTEGLSQAWARRIASAALADYGDVADFWPARHRVARHLMSLARALRCAHFPASADEAELARRRLAYDEATLLQVALAVSQRTQLPGVQPVAHVTDGPIYGRLRDAMPFALTDDQQAAVDDILADMARPRPMSRLLLGDVGTGKTAVATCALGVVADTGTQAAIMAPTGVLAAQYAQKVGPLLDEAHISWALLTGATPAAERAATTAALAAGELCVLFGTHALLSEDVSFARLSLVVIDEQQRFGVRQRHALRDKGRGADLLVMSATPIPRTLALSLYGDLDPSYLRQRPVKGAGITTRVIAKRDRRLAYEAIAQAIEAGRQAYVVCPLIGTKAPKGDDAEEADTAVEEVAQGGDPSDAKAAEVEAKSLQRSVFPQAHVGLLTGRMSPDEKQRIMDAFRAGDIDVLVSTTVIEVGVDVPNATVMLIEDGERFGLAQLHQLRGRVGRGRHPGEVFVAASTKAGPSRERMEALERTSDGYELALYDLKLRHEGEVLGSRQSGDASLRFVDLSRDEDLLLAARADARALIETDPLLGELAHRPVRDEVIARYGDVFKEVSGG